MHKPAYAALALVWLLASAGQPALAAPSGAGETRYFMQAIKARGTALICVGDSVAISVNIVRAQVSQGNVISAENVAGARVTGAVADPSVGALDRATGYTGWRGDPLGRASFSFLAQKPGSTTLSFEGHIHFRKGILDHFSFAQRNDLVSDQVAVTVQDCDYQVTVFSTWKEPGRKDVAIVSEAPLAADAPGHYTGTGTVTWTLTEAQALNGCPLHAITSTSQANLTAQLDTINGQLVVAVTYPLARLIWYTYRSDDCTRGSEIDFAATAARLDFTVGIGGGTGTLKQDVTMPGYGIANGSAAISVVRVPKS